MEKVDRGCGCVFCDIHLPIIMRNGKPYHHRDRCDDWAPCTKKQPIPAATLKQIRRAKTMAGAKYGIGGSEKTRHAPKVINLRLPPEKR